MRSNGSARSAASYKRLESRHATDKLGSLISMQAQMDAKGAGKRLSPAVKQRLMRLAADEAKSLVSSGAVKLSELPSKVRPGFLNSATGDLAAEIQGAAARVLSGLVAEAKPEAPLLSVEEDKDVLIVDTAQPKLHSKFQRRLPPVSVAGKQIALETVIRDKIQQRGQGGAHQLRKAFSVIDREGTGEITCQEMDSFLRSINIKVNEKTLWNFFELWAGEATREDLDRASTTMREEQVLSPGGQHWVSRDQSSKKKTTLNYMEFIEKILPSDYPRRTVMYADDIGTLAFEDRKGRAFQEEAAPPLAHEQ